MLLDYHEAIADVNTKLNVVIPVALRFYKMIDQEELDDLFK